MRKSSLFVAAGTAVLFCGCPTTPITNTRTVVPAPMEDPVSIEQPAPITPADPSWEAPAKPAAKPQVTVPVFEPMTGVTSSGGVDHAPRSKGRKSGKKSGKTIAPAGGKYIVQPGDTPERIARKHHVRLSALMAVNNLDQQSARRLQIGQKLVIPGKDAKVAPAKKAGKKAVAVKNTPAAVDNDGKYVVQSGDTPERIARKHRVRLSELLKANNLDQHSARRLQIGQKLVIPGKTVVTEVKPPVTEDVPDLPVPVMPPVNADATATDVTATDTAATDTTATTADASAATVTPAPAVTTEATDSESEIQMVSIDANTTAAELAAKYNVSADVISQKNSGKTEFLKGDLVFVPKN